VFSPENLTPLDVPQNAGELSRFLAVTLHETRGGCIDPRVANAIAQLAGSYLRSIEVSDVEARLDALEKRDKAGALNES
jgi:hypothetical protein